MDAQLKLIGVELYSEDLGRSRQFYADVLGLPLAEEDPERFAQFAPAGAFLCLERKGVEEYPSEDRAVVFFQTPDLQQLIQRVGEARFVRIERDASAPWAVLHDPDGHNILIVEGTGVQ